MSSPRVLYVTASAQPPSGWSGAAGELRLAPDGNVRNAFDAGSVDVAVVDATCADPVGAVRELRTADPAVQAVVLTPSAERARLERALLFAPGIGETWIRERLDDGVIAEAAAVTRQRRSYRQLQQQLSGMVPHPAAGPVRPMVSDAYLAALLQVLPDPAIALDADLAVVYWSDAAEQLLGISATTATGRSIRELIHTCDWNSLVQRARTEPVREELQLQLGTDNVRTVDVAVAPILLPRQGGYAVVLHDITAERRVQAELEQQAHELEAQAAELETLAAELQQIAAEREELLAGRERTLAELNHAMEVRSRFYASMNHEIRTPINAVLGYTDLLVSGTYGDMPPQQLHALQQSQRAARHLIEIVNDLLDLSKLEAGRMDLQLSAVSVPELLDELLATTTPLAAEHGSQLRVDAERCPQPLITDVRRVRQILLNLVSNAAKFGEGKPIMIRCLQIQDGVAIEIEDQGIGIAEKDLPAIFEEFMQVGGGTRGGTGLGLPISRRLAQLLGGRLTATSTPGDGSTFRLELPRTAPIAPEDEPRGE